MLAEVTLRDPFTTLHARYGQHWTPFGEPVKWDPPRILNGKLALTATRLDRVLPFREARDEEDEKHVHPLQLDVIDRALVLWSNPGELVLDPFAGIGTTGYVALQNERRFVGCELKRSYFEAACRNIERASNVLTLGLETVA